MLNIKPVTRLALALVILFPMQLVQVAQAKVIREDQCRLSSGFQIPLNKWSNPNSAPKAVVVALHGLSLHGGSYNSLAQALANDGYVVFAPDMRGFGRWIKSDTKSQVDYYQSQDDIVALAKLLDEQYPHIPKYYMGESMGAIMALRVASVQSKSVDGLILSNPAIKTKVKIWTKLCKAALVWVTNPTKQLNLQPYIHKYASDDPRIAQEILDDPLVRKQLRFCELIQSSSTIKSALNFVDDIPHETPILILEGSADRTIKANAVVLLLSRLQSNDQTVHWLPKTGHVMLETSYLRSTALEVISNWLNQHSEKYNRIESAQQEENTSIKLN